MTTLWSIIALWALLTAAIWIGIAGWRVWQVGRLAYLEDLEAEAPATWPTVSMVIPACNEAETIEPALQSILALDYPALEVIVVDDRSDDGTGAIVDRVADGDERVEVVHIDKLPDGWLGKTHALHRGSERATGDWLLFTDADIVYRDGALEHCLSVAIDGELDHLTCFPWPKADGLVRRTIYASFLMGMLDSLDLRAVEDPEADDFIGAGAFNLVRREVFEQTEGFEWLRMEVADDLGLGKMIQQQRRRSRMLIARELLELDWYPTLGAAVRGLEKNSFAALGHYHVSRVLVAFVGWCLIFWGPVAGLVHPAGWVVGLSAGAIGVHLAVLGGIARRLGRPILPFLLLPIGFWFLFYILLRSAVVCTRRGGIDWRGTVYELEELRRGQRVKM